MAGAETIVMQDVALEPATAEQACVLANLIQLYAHDLSGVFGLDLGGDGRFAYEKLPLYWTEPDRRFAFLLRCGGRLAGFALVTRGSPVSDDPAVFDIAEFFVARRYRRTGVGRRAAFALWDRFAGPWTVRVSEGNATGCRFWAGIIDAYVGDARGVTARPGSPHAWRVFSFDSRGRRPAT